MLSKIFNIFRKKSELITIYRRKFPIVMEKSLYDTFTKNGFTIGIILYKNKPCCIQLKHYDKEKKTAKYSGTLKTYLDVKGFKDGNICNFDPSNLIKE